MEKMREEFEKAATELYGGDIGSLLARRVLLNGPCAGLDEYVQGDVNAAWLMWQACWLSRSREAESLICAVGMLIRSASEVANTPAYSDSERRMVFRVDPAVYLQLSEAINLGQRTLAALPAAPPKGEK